MLSIASDLLDQIRAHAAGAPGREVCGLLLGGPGCVAAVVACDNVAADPACRFEIDPAALLAAHRAGRRAGGMPVIGHYHSHPSGLAVPSPRDAADAAPDGTIWLIVGAGEVRAWRAVAAGEVEGRFDPLAIHPHPSGAARLPLPSGEGSGPRAESAWEG